MVPIMRLSAIADIAWRMLMMLVIERSLVGQWKVVGETGVSSTSA